MQKPLLWITAAFIVGIMTAGKILFFPAVVLILATACSILLTGVLVYRNSQHAVYMLLVLAFATGVLRTYQSSVLPHHDIGNFVTQEQTVATIIGTITEYPQITYEQGHTKVVYLIDAQQLLGPPQGKQNVSGTVRVTVKQKEGTVFRHGDLVQISGRLYHLTGSTNPGAPDYGEVFRNRGITAGMSIKKPQHIVYLGSDSPNALVMVLEHLRDGMIANFKRNLPPQQSAMLEGLLFGYSGNISSEWLKLFADTGVVHILSVSGFHVMVLVWLTAPLVRRKPFVGVPLTLCLVLSYVIMSGSSAPAVRSAIMTATGLLALVAGRPNDGVNALSLAALVMLVYNPLLLHDMGFQLSFMATAGLVCLAPVMAKVLQFRPRVAAQSIAVTVAAQLAVLPLLAAYFNSLPLISLLTNLLVSLPVSIAIVLGLASGLLGLMFPMAGAYLDWCNGLVIGMVMQAVALSAKVPFAKVYLLDIPVAAGVLYYVLLLWVFGLWKPWGTSFATVIRVRGAKPIAVLTVVAFVLASQNALSWPETLKVYFLDVGQGDCVYIETPNHRHILIDAGNHSPTSNFDVGEKIVVPFLRKRNVKELELVVVTHPHSDHMGGVPAVLRESTAKHLLVSPLKDREGNMTKMEQAARAQGATVIKAQRGQTITVDGVVIYVLSPPVQAVSNQPNQNSVVLKVVYRQTAFLLTGDMEKEQEAELVSQTESNPSSTVLKVAHHGSAGATSQDFLDVVNPAIAVIQVGSNAIGLPHGDTLDRLRENQVKVFRTDEHGAVICASDGRKVSVTVSK